MGAEFHSGSEKKQIYYISILKKKYLKTDTFHLQILFKERDTSSYLFFYKQYCIGSCTLLIWDTPGSQRVQKQLGEKESYASRAICLPAAGRVSRVNHRWPLIRDPRRLRLTIAFPLSVHVCKQINLLHVQLRLTSRALETSARCTLWVPYSRRTSSFAARSSQLTSGLLALALHEDDALLPFIRRAWSVRYISDEKI